MTLPKRINEIIEEQLETKTALVPGGPNLTPNLITTIPKTRPLTAPLVYPQTQTGGGAGGINMHVVTDNMQGQPPSQPGLQPQLQTQTVQPSKATGLISRTMEQVNNFRQRSKGTGSLTIQTQRPITNFATPATPGGPIASNNSSKIVNLINELYVKDASVNKEEKLTTWE